MSVAIISFVGFCLSAIPAIVFSVKARHAGEKLPKGAVLWGIVFAGIQLFLAAWACLGLIPVTEPLVIVAAVIANLVICGCVHCTFNCNRILQAGGDRLASGAYVGKRSQQGVVAAGIEAPGTFDNHPLLFAVLAMLLAGLFAMLGLEISSNHDVTWWYPLCALLEWWLITMVMLGAFFLSGRRAVAPAIVAVAVFVLGLAEHFVITFKSMPIQPGDLSALSTAAAVSEGYTYSLNAFCLFSLAFLALAMLLCQCASALAPKRTKGNKKILIANILVGVLCLSGVAAHVTLLDYYHTLGITIYTWRPLESYYRETYLPAFISAAQTINPPKPENYNVDEAKALIDSEAAAYDSSEDATSEARTSAVAQFDEEKPTVIAVMNETFSDLSIYENLHADYQGPQFFKSLSDCLSRGALYVSAYGGGTANSEYEFLTGNSMANLGAGVYPYTIYDLTETENLTSQFKSMGYATTAMHPNHGTNWNRENVYADFGFDQFLTIQDFEGADKLRGMVTDQATYDKILELLGSTDQPQFIFDVTMQNHSGYDTNALPQDARVDLSIDGVSNAEVNEYVSLIEQSDKALEYFIGKLRELDKKVVLVFFGDHQPFFPDTYNDAWFTNEDDATHQERLWQTDYIIWANYDVAGNDQTSQVDDLSSNYLAAKLMQLIGAPMTNYEKAQIVIRRDLPAINATGYENRNGVWELATAVVDEAADEAAKSADEAKANLATMQYYQMFKDGKSIYTKHFQAAANETNPNLDPGTTKIK